MVPSTKHEQCRIAEILRVWDKAIEMIERLVAAKKHLLQAVKLRAFEDALSRLDEIIPAKEILEPVSERYRPDLPLLAVMQDMGVVRRADLDRRVVMPEGDISSYKVIRPGDFVISLRSFEGGLEYSEIDGLVSPAYTVLRPKVGIDSNYYRHFFKSSSFVDRLDRLIFGIRDGKQISFRDFGDLRIPNPRISDQLRVARALESAISEVKLTIKNIELLERQKRGLMRKLLTGEWRLPGEVDALAQRAAEAAE
jgi:type I restriction enzyme S subunit